MDYTELISAVLKVVVIVVSMFLIPWIKKRISANDLDKILTYIEIFVAAAEQIFTIEQFEEKKHYVLQRLAEIGVNIDSETIDAQIEAAVLRLHHELRDYSSEE